MNQLPTFKYLAAALGRRWTALLFGPLVYAAGLIGLLVVSILMWRVMSIIDTFIPAMDMVESIDDSILFWFSLTALPALIAGYLVPPPVGRNQWLGAFAAGMVAAAVPALSLGMMWLILLPDVLSRSAGDAGKVAGIAGFIAAAQLLAGLGGILRWRSAPGHAAELG
ncbi:MAG: hypothetical protein ABIJ96_03240 [Elusimicrobiota bacterium]